MITPDHVSALLIDASRDLAFISDILASSPHLITDHHWAIGIIMSTAIKHVELAHKYIQDMSA